MAPTTTKAFGWPVTLRPGAAIAAVLFSGMVGLVFGLFPARRAARYRRGTGNRNLRVGQVITGQAYADGLSPLPNGQIFDYLSTNLTATQLLYDFGLSTGRADLSAADRRIRADQESLSAARGSFGPNIHLSATVTDNGPLWTPGPFDSRNLRWNRYALLSLTWPLFEGLRTEGLVKEMKATLNQTVASRSQLLLTADVEIERARRTIAAAKEGIRVSDITVESARERLKLAEGRYRVGAGTVLELADAQLGLGAAQVAQVQTRFALSSARARLLHALGDTSTPDSPIAKNSSQVTWRRLDPPPSLVDELSHLVGPEPPRKSPQIGSGGDPSLRHPRGPNLQRRRSRLGKAGGLSLHLACSGAARAILHDGRDFRAFG